MEYRSELHLRVWWRCPPTMTDAASTMQCQPYTLMSTWHDLASRRLVLRRRPMCSQCWCHGNGIHRTNHNRPIWRDRQPLLWPKRAAVIPWLFWLLLLFGIREGREQRTMHDELQIVTMHHRWHDQRQRRRQYSNGEKKTEKRAWIWEETKI